MSCNKSSINNTETLHTYQTMEPVQNGETWHKHYGHISYSGLQKLLDKYMVEGFTVDKTSPKPDCEACIQAKQTIEPFNKTKNQITKPGNITHINLWGKYDIASIHGNQYYILFVDDAA